MRLTPAAAVRAWRTPDGPVTVEVSVDGREILVTAHGEGATWAVDRADLLLGECDDAAGFDHRLHPAVRDATRRLPGLRLGRSLAVTDAVIASVVEQKVTSLDAHRTWRRLQSTLGEPAPGNLGLTLPVDPHRLAATPWWTLHSVGLERRRAECLQRVAACSARLEALATQPPDTADAALQSIAGVGPWTAAEVRLVALGDADAVSVGDWHLPSMVAWALAGEPRATDDRMLELLEPWRGHRGRVLRLLGAAGHAAPRRGPRMPDVDIARLDGPAAEGRWSGRPGSNWGPRAPKARTLPTAPRPGRRQG